MKTLPLQSSEVGAEFAGSFPMLFKGNSMSDPAPPQERLVPFTTHQWPFNAILLLSTHQEGPNVPHSPAPAFSH